MSFSLNRKNYCTVNVSKLLTQLFIRNCLLKKLVRLMGDGCFKLLVLYF